jgi:hypothetical protein
VHEALRRGATTLDLWILASKYRRWLSRDNPMSGAFGSMASSLETDWIQSVIELEKHRFEIEIDLEIARISHLVGAKSQIKDKEDYRYRKRPLYHAHGYLYPADFLEKVHLYSVLGKFEVWVHDDLAAMLAKAPGILEGWSRGLAAQTARQIHSTLGIQIRNIAGSDSLSNHAFGLAIDIDAYSNPRVATRAAIDVFNSVVREQGISFDFGKFVLAAPERGHAEYTIDDVMEIHNRGTTASEIVRGWLAAHLPRYLKLIAEVEAGEKELPLAKGDKFKLGDTLDKTAQSTGNAEYRAFSRAEAKSPEKICESPSPLSPEHLAAERVRNALRTIEGDVNLKRIQVLYENYERKYVETWAKQGVLTIPMYLACALVVKFGLRWGELYENSKDGMHFELMGQHDRPYIPAEIPVHKGEKPRTLKALMETAFAGSDPPVRKQHTKHKKS